MKKKKGIVVLIASLITFMLLSNAIAITQPQPTPPLQSITQPTPPTTNTQGECSYWEVKDEYCDGDLRFYTQCIKTASGGKWQQKSEFCSDYGENVICITGRCQKQSETQQDILTILIILAIIWLITKGEKK